MKLGSKNESVTLDETTIKMFEGQTIYFVLNRLGDYSNDTVGLIRRDPTPGTTGRS